MRRCEVCTTSLLYKQIVYNLHKLKIFIASIIIWLKPLVWRIFMILNIDGLRFNFSGYFRVFTLFV